MLLPLSLDRRRRSLPPNRKKEKSAKSGPARKKLFWEKLESTDVKGTLWAQGQGVQLPSDVCTELESLFSAAAATPNKTAKSAKAKKSSSKKAAGEEGEASLHQAAGCNICHVTLPTGCVFGPHRTQGDPPQAHKRQETGEHSPARSQCCSEANTVGCAQGREFRNHAGSLSGRFL